MDEPFTSKLARTAEEMAHRFNEAAQQAGERISEMREVQRLSQQIRTLKQEREHCRMSIADMVVRMFDQNAFVEALLRPEYQRIKDIDLEVERLEQERREVGTEQTEGPIPQPSPDAPNNEE